MYSLKLAKDRLRELESRRKSADEVGDQMVKRADDILKGLAAPRSTVRMIVRDSKAHA